MYTFVDDLGTALARARETAGHKNISVMGAAVGRQLLNAGAIDEVSVHLVPVCSGAARRCSARTWTSTSRSSS